MRERLLMDPQWKFHYGDFPVPERGEHWCKSAGFRYAPIDPSFDDGGWRTIDLPHDFVVEGDFIREKAEDFARQSRAGQPLHARMHVMHGFRKGGVGWYRKQFTVPGSDRGRILKLTFDGIFRNSTVWLNRHFLGRHLSGYTGVEFDIAEIVEYGDVNTLVVRVDATEYEGWFYEGGGIYRHAWLTKLDPVHVTPEEVFVSADIDLKHSACRATLAMQAGIRNAGLAPREGRLVSEVRDPDGRVAARVETDFSVAPLETSILQPAAVIDAPRLWSLESPELYTLASRVVCGGETVDEHVATFGIRSLRFDPDRGFFLNEKPVKLKGVCCHQDHAGVGAALPDSVQEFRIRRLKEMGCNAYRTSHNPPTPELLDACDRLGMLVMDENRLLGVAPEILGQLSDLVRRDRNHPSVILWSLGNEENHVQATVPGARIVASMRALVRKLDPTRPVTLAINATWEKGASREIDVMGCNYIATGDVDAYHANFPTQPLLYSESVSANNTRGIYALDDDRCYVPAYDRHAASWGHTHEENWVHCDQRPFVAGTFVWTGFDYRGEPTPFYSWPNINSHFGIVDTCGFPKDPFYYYQAWWGDRPMLHLLPHWNWNGREGQPIDVWVYSNCDEVELFLNGTSLGRKTMQHCRHLEWQVPFNPGKLSATGWIKGREAAAAAEKELRCSCSDLRPAPADIGAAPPPPADLVFSGEEKVLVGAFWDVRKLYQGRDGLLYLRANFQWPAKEAGCLVYGADGPLKIWVNGNQVACQWNATNPARRDEYKTRVEWRAGQNEIVVALLTRAGKTWGVFLHPAPAG